MRLPPAVLALAAAPVLVVAAACSAPCPPANPAGVGSTLGGAGSDPCGDFVSAICAEAGEASDVCQSVRTAVELFPVSACRVAVAEIELSLQRWREARGACVVLAAQICERLGEESRGCGLVRQQIPDFSPDKCRALSENLDAVVQELQCMEREGQPLPAEVWSTLIGPSAPAFGPADARVTLVIFSDFECPFCGLAAKAIEKVRERFAGRPLRVVFHQFPLDRHPNARFAAAASLEAQVQGRFWEFHDLVFAHQDELGPALLEGLAGQAGLELEAYRAAVREDRWGDVVDAELALGAQACVSGTPSLFLDGLRLAVDPRDPEELLQALEQALGEAAPPTPTTDGTPAPPAADDTTTAPAP